MLRKCKMKVIERNGTCILARTMSSGLVMTAVVTPPIGAARHCTASLGNQSGATPSNNPVVNKSPNLQFATSKKIQKKLLVVIEICMLL